MIGHSATEIAAAIARGTISARAVTEAALARVEAHDAKLNAFTEITRERALAEADAIDARRTRGEALPPLAGVPYAVKNLFDVAGVTTLAGSKINRERAPAASDARAIKRLHGAGAVLIGTLNMDEYAYGFTTENSHYGPAHNPHDLGCIAGGSSGGSAAAVAGGLVQFSLGTDTSGSIRVPASLCGLFGLKPTFGRLSRAGVFPFVSSFDHIGPMARSVADLAAIYDIMQGPDRDDPACAQRQTEPVSAHLPDGIRGLRVARAGGYFDKYCGPDTAAAVAAVAASLGAQHTIELPEAERARGSAFLITSAEGSNLHWPNLRSRPQDFDPVIRDRLLAGVLAPGSWYLQAQRFRRWFRAEVLKRLESVDVLIAGGTPLPAQAIGTEWVELGGERLPARPAVGLLTQPISFIGLPVVVVPFHRPGNLPVGVQLIGAPWREDLVFRAAAHLERAGVVSAPIAAGFA